MAEDWLLVRIAEVEEAASALIQGLHAAPRVLAPARQARLAGDPLVPIAVDLFESGAEPRLAVQEALRAYQHAVSNLRSEIVCALVDDEHVSLTLLSNRMGISRQAVTRLYQVGRSLHSGSEDHTAGGDGAGE